MRAPGRSPKPKRAHISLLASIAIMAVGSLTVGPMLVAAQTALDPSNVVLVFDVSNSILLSDDGTNVEFAAALNGIADRVEASATDLAVGNAEISFVAFGRTAITYPDNCDRLSLHEDPAAIAQLEACLRSVAAEYQAGPNAPVRQRINTQDTDHVAALREAAELLPNETTRSAVIFFTDGAHDPPGTARDDENVIAAVRPAFEGQSPLAILPVGLGAGAGAFESELRAIYDAFFRDMEPCEGRASFSWPEVVFPAADDAGIAVAQALQEVTCSFTFVPTPSASPSPTPEPTPGGPGSVQLLAGNESVTVQWTPPASGAELVLDYLVHCRPQTGGDWIESTEGVSTVIETVVEGLQPGVAYECEVATVGPGGTSDYTASAEAVVVLGIPAAPGQPRVESLDAAARVSVDPVAGGAPAERYVIECTGAAGGLATGSDAAPSVVVAGLTNGDTVTCIAYAENRIGRSPPSVASAAFTPCAALDCNPLLKYGLIGAAVLVALAVAAYVARRYAMRNRVWISAQVDGGENRSLGWGPELGIRLEREDEGWFAKVRPLDGSAIRVRYEGKARFLVNSKAGAHDVHQGDPAPVRDEAGNLHQLIVRLYRRPPRERTRTPAPVDPKAGAEVGARLEGKDDEPKGTNEPWVG
jgi:hypothetical protein